MNRFLACTLLLLTACATPTPARSPGADSACAGGVRVATYNLLEVYAEHAQRYLPWPERARGIAAWVNARKVAILGVQEDNADMLDALAGGLQGFVRIGRVSSDGTDYGEFNSIFVDQSRFRAFRSGAFSLSRRPAEIGRYDWDSSLPRIATWAELEDLSTHARFTVVNTHFDHQGSQARLESSRQLQRWAARHAPAVVMGDLNAAEESPELSPLMVGMANTRAGRGTGPEHTFESGGRIDHVFTTPAVRACAHVTDDPRAPGGERLSDHNPVYVDLAVP